MRRGLAVLVAAAIISAACSDDTTETTTPLPASSSSFTTTTATTTSLTTTTTQAAAASFTMQDHIAWLIGGLNGEAVTERDVEDRLDEGFRAAVPTDQFLTVFTQLGGTWTIVDQSVSPDDRQAMVVATSELGRFIITMNSEGSAPNRLSGAFIQPAPEVEAADSLDAVPERLAEYAPVVEFVVADVGDGMCNPIAGDLSERRLPVGSAFKLWVLGALADAVGSGAVAWDDRLVISDELKSLPSGTMQNEAAGTEFTLAEFASAMISISDNTATDHLIDYLGRSAVEQAQAEYGHRDPSLNEPFLTTAELFYLRGLASDDEITRYEDGDTAERRAILEAIDADLSDIDIGSFLAGPGEIETIEWLASVGDLCRALVALDMVSKTSGMSPVWDALSLNPGVGIDPADFPRVGFKGGSEPGVLALAWIVERNDGRRFVVAAILMNPEDLVEEVAPALLLETVFPLIAEI